MNESLPVKVRTGVQDNPAAVVLLVHVGEDDEDGKTLVIDLRTARAVDNMIESLMMARCAAFGLGVPSNQPLGYRYHRTG